MAITTDRTITIHGVEVGISKPIQTLIANGDFTYEELSKYAIVGRHDFVNNVAGVFEPDTYSYMAGTSAAISELEKYPVLNSPTAPGWDSVLYTYFGAGKRSYDNYGKMVLVYNMISSANNITRNFNDGNEACIVTEFNPRLIKMLGNIYTGTIVADAGDTGTYTTYDPEGSSSFVWMDDDTSAPFRSMCIQNFDDAVYFDFPLYDNIFTTQQNVSGNRDSTYASLQYVFDDFNSTGNKILSVWCDGGIDDFLVGANYGTSFNGVHDMSDDRGDKILGVRYVPYGAECFVKASSLDTALKQLAGCGFYFEVSGTVYKPIAEGGIVIGYTAELDKNSEWDLINDVTGNTIPDTPGGGGGGDGDDPWHGVDFGGTGAGGGGAFCSVYYMTGAQLTSLKNWSNTSAPEGFDMLPSIIGLQQLPVSITGVATTVKFLKSAAITSQGESRLVDTGVAAGTGTGQPVSFSLGSVDINRRMQQRGEPYLDYDCTVELFLPFAGTFVLDTQAVMGRTINAEIVIDPVNGTAFAYAWVSQGGQKMPIAYGGGSIAVDLPIASNQWGISRAAFKQASHQMTMNAIKDIGDFIIGLGISKTGQAGAIANRSGYAALDIKEGLQAKQIGGQMMTSSTINAATDTASAIVNAHQLNNTNYTAIRGSFGGSYAEWAQPFTAYVRITRPKFKKPSNFNHTQAVPCVEAKTLSSCSGLTICINPDCGSISCTEAEKIMITQALVGGVYAGGGQ